MSADIPTADAVKNGLILDLSHSTSSVRVPRILIAEKHGSTVDSLIQTCGDRQRNLDVDVYTSHRSAVRKLLASPYQLIISSVHLAEIDDFLLLHRTQVLEAGVPVVITAATGEKASARRVLEQGAFDLIATPLEQTQTVSTIRLALLPRMKPVLPKIDGESENLMLPASACGQAVPPHVASRTSCSLTSDSIHARRTRWLPLIIIFSRLRLRICPLWTVSFDS